MLKYLGIFGVLAVCLFVLMLAMGGGEWVERVGCCEETMRQKFASSYALVSGSVNGELVPGITGKFTRLRFTDAWSMEFSASDADFRASVVLWRATELILKFIGDDGLIENVPYRWIGERLETEFPYGDEIIILTWEDSFR